MTTQPTISTYITTINSLFWQSTLEQTIMHALLFSDEIIVSVSENTTDGTYSLLDIMKSEHPNIIKTFTYKNNYDKLQKDLSDRKTFALSRCTKDYCVLQDDDECIHEKFSEYIKQLPIISPKTIAFRFNTIHFYRSYYRYQPKHNDWYNKKIYMVKNIPEIKHGKVKNDPDNYLIKLEDNRPILSMENIPQRNTSVYYRELSSLGSPSILSTPVTSYHYGWANRNDAVLLLKKYYQEIEFHGNNYWNEHKFPFKFDDPNDLPEFKGTHPKYMIPVIEKEQKLNSKHVKEFTNH